MNIHKAHVLSIIYGIIDFLFTFLQNILLVPIILSYWSTEKYGLWLLCYGFITLMRTLDAGHQSYIGNEFMKLFHINRTEAQFILGSSLKVVFLIGFIEFLIFFIAVLFKLENLLLGIKTDTFLNISILCMLFAWWLIGSASGILIKTFLPIDLFNRTILWSIIYKILELVIILISIFSSWSIAIIFILLSVSFFIYCLFALYDIKKKLPFLYPWWQYGTLKQGIKGFQRSLLLTLNNLIEQVSNNGLIILIGNLVNTSVIPSFTTLRTVSNVFLQANQVIINPLVPEMVKYHVQNDKKNINNILITTFFILNFVLILPVILILPFLKNLYNIWTNHQIIFDGQLASGLILSVIMVSFGRVIMAYLGGINHINSLLSRNIVKIVILFPLSYYLVKHYGISYLWIPICLSEVFASIVIPLFFVKQELLIDFSLKKVSIMLIGGLLPIPLILFNFCENFSLFFYYLIGLISLSILVFIQWKIALNQDSQNYIYKSGHSIIKKLFKK